ncbi:theta defensin subunit A-like [Hylobates moloch]|uniref:theta defensin subunit A-like n=1 Tax=Hylobates moloch TaxID=81572 RepID=UPI0013641FBF|nr:theta defensin subunit A-like [Hylobates moloch]
MRTLALLTATILLVALQALGEPLQARADEAAAQEQTGADDQEVAHAFTWDESAALPLSGSGRGLRCICRRPICRLALRRFGSCAFGRFYQICCR